jgi:hypothetical protein
MHQRTALDNNFHHPSPRHLSHMEQCVAWLSRGPERTVDRPLVTLGQYFWEACSEAFSRQQRVTIPAPREREPLQALPTATDDPEETSPPGAPPRLSAQSKEADVRAWLQKTLHVCVTTPLPITIPNMARCAQMSCTIFRKIIDAHPGVYATEKRRVTSPHRP